MFTKLGRSSVVFFMQLGLSVFYVATAQAFEFEHGVESVALMQVQSDSQEMHDYFSVATNRFAQDRLRVVEQYHFNKELFEKIARGNYTSALGEIDFVLRYFPNHPKALQLLTTVAALAKRNELTIRYFEKAIALYPSHAITHAQYGRFFAMIGDVTTAITKLNYALELDPKLTAGYVWLAQAYEKKGDMKTASQLRDRAKELGYAGEAGK